MASYYHLIHQSKKHVESPAKVFAKLKSKVQRETYESTVGGKDAQCNVREKHGSNFHTPRRRRISDEFKENQREGNIHGEVKALTLSPIRSPQKGLGFLYSEFDTRPVEELPFLSETGHTLTSRNGCTPTKRAFLESTTLSYQPSNEIRPEQPLIRHLDGFTVQTQSPENKVSSRRNVFKTDSAPHCRTLSADTGVSAVKMRLRKRKLEPRELNEVSNRAEEGKCQPKERKTTAAFIDDSTFTDDSETCPIPSEPMFAIPAQPAKPRSKVGLDRFPLMSPAKMFAYMKERESKRGQTEVPKVSNTTRKLFDDADHQCQPRDEPDSTVSQPDRTDDMHFGDACENMPSASLTKIESSDNQSDIHPPDSEPPSAVPSQPVLVEDPLVLNSPRVSIPKKPDEMVKHNKWFQHATFPTESVIYLKKWFLRKGQRGLFVDGIHGEENIPWNSNFIVERVSSSVLKTVSGRVYILVGKMNLSMKSEFPKWFLKKFARGFPPDWKTLYEMFLSKEKTKTKGESKSRPKKKTETSAINRSVQPSRQKPLKTPDSCNSSAVSNTKTSRSGRLIKPPLEYWKGGRVILDAQMNVTIHECYNTSICSPHITATVTTKSSKKPSQGILPWTESNEPCDSTGDTEPSAVLRKVKPPPRKCNQIKGNLEEKPSSPPEPSEEAVTHQNNNPKNWSDRITRSRHKSQRTFYMDSASKKQSEPEKSSKQRSKKQTPDTDRTTMKSRRWAVLTESPTGSESTSPNLSADYDSSSKGKKRGKVLYRKKGANVLKKSQPSYVSSSQSESSGNSGKEQRKKSQKRVTKNHTVPREADNKRSKHTKTSAPPQHLPKFTQSTKTQRGSKGNTNILQEEDEDKWTEDELMKLKEAVSYYPKHIGGYWARVAQMVGTRSAEECHNQQTSMGSLKTPTKKDKTKRKKAEPPKDPAAQHPIISARVGTLKRKQQVRNFLESMPKENVDDAFSSAHMQGKRFEMPSMCPSEDHDFAMSDLEPWTPMSTGIPEAKTPQCLHISPGMMGSPSRTLDDKYVYQLQKRMKKKYFNVHAPAAKSLTPTPSVKRTMKRCGNTENSFVVWEMFPDKEDALSESGEEEDFYFSNDD
ncbi:mis18-binding protein 1 [Sphaeramia orbicularis]|uniref:Uncharacterized protein n=1 Tax=Sphaeramia orbicularis TaxID=375764 RepID=A0A673ASS0_9TELE|nr:mis18-binding protein 1 [Sphaeramia orbicularis]